MICLGGPLSHVVNRQKRDRAVRELVRLAKPGAPIAVSVMSRLRVLVVEWKIWQATHLKTCTYPAVIGTSEHMLIVARKR